ncbi:MAG: 1-(5-phosphoribosyl)-5-[(5-phosphoribosylamino)methylideneamino]imidazole-4-carboxamide isomerase [Spirochaetales bacterium]|nr:1-(5-phosphoribosyl)-5-[(5-phosphoribosylamino)methylideneamino]imidazole-4-carboxamide isomerase [Spirochaetales bacterium]MCF7938957.1 1-(5-phosphoribosyl)-5-[(5-phosphoribosylamino)methylideneamino]imidazole-4-carboxamide isomerase [Spirochaetales bacterium]
MVIIPAIDIIDGVCVRLTRGDYDSAVEYEKDPVAMAREFEQAGAKRIHIVDLDAAQGGGRNNRKKIRKIRKAVSCELEIGGGLRHEDDVEELIDMGLDRLVIGTILVKNPGLVEGWVRHYGDMFLAGIDADGGNVRVSGWQQHTGIQDVELARQAKEMGFCGIVYTSIDRDGTMNGPDVERTRLISEKSGLPVILSGGIGSLEDLKAVRDASAQGIVGVIAGKALYEGAFSYKDAVESYQDDSKPSGCW